MVLDSIYLWLLVLSSLPFLLLLKRNGDRDMKIPPSPPKLPIIGNLHQLGTLPHKSLWHLSKRYGPVMLLHLGWVPVVVVSSPEAATDVLKTHDLECSGRPSSAGSEILTYGYLDVAFAPYGDYWRELRKICTLEVFCLKRVQSVGYIRKEEITSLMNSISKSSSSATPVNLSEKCYALTASIIFRMAFGKSYWGSDFNDIRLKQLIHETASVFGSFSAADHLPYLGWIVDMFTGHHAKIKRAFFQLDAFFQKLINDHLNPRRIGEKEDIIDVLLKIERDQTDSGEAWLKRDSLKAVLLDMFLGGIDTGAITMIWAMAELARNPRTMKRVQEEVRNSVGEKARVTEDDIDQLQYLKMVIKETLRLHPPAPIIPRETVSPCRINGLYIDQKTAVQINVWAIGRDPKYWNDPEEFVPERFADMNVDFRGHHFQFLPFGSGRRVCPGMRMGITTVELGLANLLHRFNWNLPNGMKKEDINMEEAVGVSLTLGKKTALSLVPVDCLLLLVLFSLSLLWLLKRNREKDIEIPPSPPKLPIIGNLHQLGTLPHQSLCHLSKRYGPVMLLQLGWVPSVVVSSAEAAMDVFKTHDLDCSSRPSSAGSGRLTYGYLDVAFAPHGDYWRELRKLCTLEVFSLKRVQSFRYIRNEEITSLMNSISQSSASATPVSLSEKCYALQASVIFRMAFGKSFSGSDFDGSRLKQLIHEADAVFGCFSAADHFPYVGWIIDMFTGHHAKCKRVFFELDAFFQKLINDHLKHRKIGEKEDIIDVLLKIEKHQVDSGQAWLKRDSIKAVLLDFFIAGIDTAAITMIWAMAELARNPRTMKKVQEEVRNSVGEKGRVTEDDIDQLQYLKMVIKETLRLHPPAPIIPRETVSPCRINGQKDLLTSTLILGGIIFTSCLLGLVAEFVLECRWEWQQWSLHLPISCTVSIGNCLPLGFCRT